MQIGEASFGTFLLKTLFPCMRINTKPKTLRMQCITVMQFIPEVIPWQLCGSSARLQCPPHSSLEPLGDEIVIVSVGVSA